MSVFDAMLAGGMGSALMAFILVSLSNPWYWAFREEEDLAAEAAKIPKDDPQRSPDWCHAHGKIEKQEEK